MNTTNDATKTARHITRRQALGALLGLVIAVSGAFGFSGPAAAQGGPSADQAQTFVDKLASDAISTLTRSGLDKPARIDRFRGLLERGFQMDYIGLLVLGTYSRTSTPEQIAKYQSVFKEFVLLKYAGLLDSYQGEKFVITGSQPAGKSDVVVQSRINPVNAGQPVSAEWRIREFGGDLKIIDVKFEGISMVQSQREEFASILSQGGIDRLISVLTDQVAALKAQSRA